MLIEKLDMFLPCFTGFQWFRYIFKDRWHQPRWPSKSHEISWLLIVNNHFIISQYSGAQYIPLWCSNVSAILIWLTWPLLWKCQWNNPEGYWSNWIVPNGNIVEPNVHNHWDIILYQRNSFLLIHETALACLWSEASISVHWRLIKSQISMQIAW